MNNEEERWRMTPDIRHGLLRVCILMGTHTYVPTHEQNMHTNTHTCENKKKNKIPTLPDASLEVLSGEG